VNDIGFDIRPLQTAHKFRGIGKYTAELYSALSAGREDLSLRLLSIAEGVNSQLDIDALNLTGEDVLTDHNRYRYILLDFYRTPSVVRRMDIDIMHYNMQVVPPWSPKPFVMTVHDCITAVYPNRAAFYKEKLLFKIQATAARRATAVITVSNSSRRDIVRYMDVRPEKVFVIYEACSPIYRSDAPLNELKARINLPDEYLLYVGASDYRKNLKGLIEIYGRYCERSTLPLPLVLTGSREYYENVRFTWPEGTHGGIVSGRVLFTGFLPEKLMPGLYGGARAFLFPSLYEGFGLPPLEAMACGTPVIAYDNSSVSEIVGRWGLLVPTGDTETFVNKLLRITSDNCLSKEMSHAGLERAKHFSWSKAAAETAEVYREVARCA
jgi:glycosyltransferase involved in cell wall biosynthesis